MVKISGDGHQNLYKDEIFIYLKCMRSKLLQILGNKISENGILVTALTNNKYDYFFIRILFSDIGGVDYYHNDPEWDVCMNFFKKINSKNNLPIEDGRIILTKDIGIIIKNTTIENPSVFDETIMEFFELVSENKDILFLNRKTIN